MVHAIYFNYRLASPFFIFSNTLAKLPSVVVSVKISCYASVTLLNALGWSAYCCHKFSPYVGLPAEEQVKQRLLVATCHIHWDPDYCDVKLIQTMMLMNELKNIMDELTYGSGDDDDNYGGSMSPNFCRHPRYASWPGLRHGARRRRNSSSAAASGYYRMYASRSSSECETVSSDVFTPGPGSAAGGTRFFDGSEAGATEWNAETKVPGSRMSPPPTHDRFDGYADVLQSDCNFIPLVLCGDFNSLPDSGEFNLQGLVVS